MRVVFLIMAFSLISLAEAPQSEINEQALQQTMDLHQSPNLREQALNAFPEARPTDENARNLTGTSENAEKLYGISAKAFEKLARDTNGDVTKMMERLNEAQANPEGFFNQLSPAQQKEIQSLAQEIEKIKKTEKSTAP